MEKFSSMVKRDINCIWDCGSSQDQLRAAPGGNREQNTAQHRPRSRTAPHSISSLLLSLTAPLSLLLPSHAAWNVTVNLKHETPTFHRGRGLSPARGSGESQHIPWELLPEQRAESSLRIRGISAPSLEVSRGAAAGAHGEHTHTCGAEQEPALHSHLSSLPLQECLGKVMLFSGQSGEMLKRKQTSINPDGVAGTERCGRTVLRSPGMSLKHLLSL